MRILWIAHRDPRNPRAGGAEVTIRELCTRFVSSGHTVVLLSGGWRDCRNSESLDGIKIWRFGKNIGVHLAAPIFLFKHRPDVTINDLGHAIPWLTPSFLHKKNVVFFHHLHSRSLPGQVNKVLAMLITAIEKSYFLIYPRSEFVTESRTSMEDLLKLGVDYNRINRIEPGVNTDVFRVQKKTSCPSMVYFGGMRRYKRAEESLLLANSLARTFPDLRLTIIGDGPELVNVKKYANELGIFPKVQFTGRVRKEELAKLISEAWLNVHTSKTEGWGFSILEASASGTPTVAYNVPGVSDAIKNGINGIKVKDGDRNALIKAAVKILENPQPWWYTSHKVAERYSWDVSALKWQKLLHRIMKD